MSNYEKWAVSSVLDGAVRRLTLRTTAIEVDLCSFSRTGRNGDSIAIATAGTASCERFGAIFDIHWVHWANQASECTGETELSRNRGMRKMENTCVFSHGQEGTGEFFVDSSRKVLEPHYVMKTQHIGTKQTTTHHQTCRNSTHSSG